jgi:Ser/Thr protein kinase RdoA (MazF antagonist)
MRPEPDVWLRREVDIATFLAGRGAPVVPPSAELPPGPHEHDGLFVSFWRFVDPNEGRPLDVAEAGRSLRELHAALRDFPGELPWLVPALEDVGHGLALLEKRGALADADLAMLRAEHAGLRAVLEAGGGQALHGDAHVENLLPTPDGPLWSDFEDTCRGPIAWDLTCLAGSSAFVREEALAAYGDVVDAEELDRFLEARSLQGVVWLAVAGLRFPQYRDRLEPRLRAWREHE